MRKNAYSKNIIRTVFGSFGRFISILAIIALGVGFFAGIKVTKQAMVQTFNTYVHEKNMYDFRLVSTLGFTDEEIADFDATKGVNAAEGSITKDVYSLDAKGNRVIYKVHSLTDGLNKLELSEGRMPEKANECVGDKDHFSSEDIGREIEVTDENDSSVQESFAHKKMKLVGLVSSTVYVNRTERGTAAIGDGKISAYIYVPKDNFTDEYFTEAYLTIKDGGYVYSDEYNKSIESISPRIEQVAEQCNEDRYREILAKAKKKIDDSREELQTGREELEEKKTEAYNKLKDAKAKLDTESKRLDNAEKQLKKGQATLKSKKGELEGTVTDLETKKSYAQMNVTKAQQALQAAEASGDERAIAEASKALAQAEGGLKAVSDGLTQARSGLNRVNSEISALPSKEKQIKEGKKVIDKGYKDYEEGLRKADSEFKKAEVELAEGEEEIAKAEKKLKDIEEPKLYVQTREDNAGYTTFDSNSDIVDSIADVFPVFFFLIAALVCSTTMTRMIEEERVQIGVLRALGFSRGRIMMKYMIYSGSAAIIGCIAGFFLGSKLFPLVIYTAYGMIFDYAPLEFYFSIPLALMSLVVAILCSVGTTYLACRSQLKEMPAEIMRPKAPKAGKRILLEKIGPLWRKLKFSYKVSLRNVFRYKKRMFMMILGISGCAALVLAGFGIYDSVAEFTNHQYEEIETYDITAAFEKEIDKEKEETFKEETSSYVDAFAVLEQTAVNAKKDGTNRSCNLMVTGSENLTEMVHFRNISNEESELKYPGFGECLINNKVAEILNVSEGDEISVEYDDTKLVNLKVSGIYRNYVGNYIYITPETYEKSMDKEYSPTVMFIQTSRGEDVREDASKIGDINGIAGILLNEDTRDHVEGMMKSLDYVVWLVIGCAGALAFIVLFNLTNINITERVREIATIRVLGFYKGETGAYVLRENLILTMFGIVVGIPLGIVLHRFIMSRIIVDTISFNTVLEPQSFLYTVIAVICFTLIVDVIMRRRLAKINMAEALKSVD